MTQARTVDVLTDRRMTEHRPHAGHPERPERLVSVLNRLERNGIWSRCGHPAFAAASREQLERVHKTAMIDRVQRTSESGGGYLDHGDTSVSSGSWLAATLAAGCAIGAVDSVMTGSSEAAMAVVRPPGHHATRSQSMGFCIFNNVAVAAAHAIERYGLERVLIVDFDVHHGNGTEDIFTEDPRVTFFSTHQYPAYPGTGAAQYRGTGSGTGDTVNCPLPPGTGDRGFVRVYEKLLVPVAERLRPQLILVSAGYDAHWRNSTYVAGIDERVSIEAFFEIAVLLLQLSDLYCPGRLAGVLEGGYDLEALSCGVAATLDAWLGEEHCDDPIGPSPRPERDAGIDDMIDEVKSIHSL